MITEEYIVLWVVFRKTINKQLTFFFNTSVTYIMYWSRAVQYHLTSSNQLSVLQA